MNNARRKKTKKRASGRFFALLGVVAICVILIIVFTNRRSQTPQAYTPSDGGTTATDDSSNAWQNPEIESISALVGTGDEYAPVTDENRIVADKSNLSDNKTLDPVWKNILLLASDARSLEKSKESRTDTMMILSINKTDGRVKLVSLMRDMYVPLASDKSDQKRMDKINAACYFGGPYAAIKTVNECFQMNITDYVMVNFTGMQEAIDQLGGIELDVTEQERGELNHNIKEQARLIMEFKDWDPEKYNLKAAGPATHLTGMQAVGYARIRNIGNGDFDRTRRQRDVMNALLIKAKSLGLTNLMAMGQTIMQNVDTNMSFGDAITIASAVVQNGLDKLETGSIPVKDSYENTIRNEKSALYDVDLEKNAQRLYAFIYNE